MQVNPISQSVGMAKRPLQIMSPDRCDWSEEVRSRKGGGEVDAVEFATSLIII